MAKMQNAIIRILVVEDNHSRHLRIRALCQEAGLVPIITPSAGRALGVLTRDAAEIAGVMLDYDLTESVETEMDLTLSGKHIVQAILNHLSKRTPILIHSMNPSGSAEMAQQLESSGFSVVQIPMSKLSFEEFSAWREEVVDFWELNNG